jgi:1-acyl-sn-glycerol-3-phosphate acyltransferase
MPAKFLPAPLVGVITFSVMLAALLFWVLLWFLPGALLKLLLPFPAGQRQLAHYLAWVSSRWVGTNALIYSALHGRRTRYELQAAFDPQRSWLLVSNHQSWADILILLDVMHRRAPFPRFFLKRELIWVPVIGFVCWALDMPFMTRSSKKDDLEATRRFCDKYRSQPVTVVNYLEGTRFTEAKRVARNSPYRHLLRPKSAGLSFTLKAMGEQFAGLIDLSIVYVPCTPPKLWSFLCGGQREVHVIAACKPLPQDLMHGDYSQDAAFRERFQSWVNGLWADKDRLLERELSARAPGQALAAPEAN